MEEAFLHEAVKNPDPIGVVSRQKFDENLKRRDVRRSGSIRCVDFNVNSRSHLVEERQEVRDAADFLQNLFEAVHLARRDVPDVDQTRSVFVAALTETLVQP